MRQLISTFLLLLGTASSFTEPTDIPVANRAVIQRCVIEGPSARMIAVGFPSGFNYAFDAQNCAPVYVWQGGFLNFAGETLGRGGRRCQILGVKQSLGTAINPLRIDDPDSLPDTLVFKGYSRDSRTGTPTFRFEANGFPVKQSIESPAKGIVKINLEFSSVDTGEKFYHLDPSKHEQVTLSEGLRWHRPGVVAIPSRINRATISITLKDVEALFVRKTQPLSGAQLYSYYCRACHSNDGTKLIGPSFKGLWGRTRELDRQGKTDTVVVDSDYIRESITDPQAAVVEGYENVPMPSFATILSDRDIETLVEYFRDSN